MAGLFIGKGCFPEYNPSCHFFMCILSSVRVGEDAVIRFHETMVIQYTDGVI